MSEQIYINHTAFETRVAVIEQGTTQEIHIERQQQRGKVGNIYLGKVVRVLPGMQSAFIDIGLEKAAFIHIADLRENRELRLKNHSATYTPIEKILFEGQVILVQVIKDPIGTKGARLTNQISIAGRILVYMPFDNHIGVSQKIESEQERIELKDRLCALLNEQEKGGYILRTQAENASNEELAQDISYLKLCWSNIQQQALKQAATTLLYEDLTLYQRVLRDLASEKTELIEVDDAATADIMREWAKTYSPKLVSIIRSNPGEPSLFEKAHVEAEIQNALARRVNLNSGGYLVIDEREALTSIDVNTGGYVSGRNFIETVFKTNLEAAVAIARQLRLRNLGGIIIIDFIDMDNIDHQTAVLNELQKALQHDRVRTTISGFSSLGLVEITRKRTRDSLSHLLCEACPTCQSRGNILTARSVCYHILREIYREARQFNPKEFRIIASQTVIDLFLEEESYFLANMGDQIGKPITLEVDNTYSQEQYDIVLF